jgi:hypothetical protein
LANDRLNHDNLQALDAKIGREVNNRDRKDAILDDRKSERAASVSGRSVGSRLSAQNLNRLDNDVKSQGTKSVVSMRSRSAYQRSNVGSITSTRKPPPTEVYSEINENDEWAAIQKFNTLLHFEE